jgi:hypothetical protein
MMRFAPTEANGRQRLTWRINARLPAPTVGLACCDSFGSARNPNFPIDWEGKKLTPLVEKAKTGEAIGIVHARASAICSNPTLRRPVCDERVKSTLAALKIGPVNGQEALETGPFTQPSRTAPQIASHASGTGLCAA